MPTNNNNHVKFSDQNQVPYDEENIDPNKYIDNQNYGLDQGAYLEDNQSGGEIIESEQYDTDNERQEQVQTRARQQPEVIYHFQTRIKNSGYWGKVKLRNGSKLILVSLGLFVASVVLIGVFWGFWYSHPLNYPMRILAITLLSLSVLFFILGLVSNYFMSTDSENKRILGSPFHRSTYALIGSFFGLVVASDLITMYYSYWHNRWVNTPMIIIAIILYFFCGIGFIVSLRFVCLRLTNPNYDHLRKEAQKKKQTKPQSDTEEESEPDDNLQRETVEELRSETYSETTRKDFRKKMLKLTPRPVVNNTVTSEYKEV